VSPEVIAAARQATHVTSGIGSTRRTAATRVALTVLTELIGGPFVLRDIRRTVADEWRGQASRASTACHEGYTLSFGFQRLTKGKATSTRSACSAAPNLGFAHLFCRMAIQRITSAAHARTA
jgi:hypothetical protein